MIEVEIDDKMRRAAKARARDLGNIKNSITKGKGNFAGFLGEEVVLSFLGGRHDSTFDYDILYKELRIEVKTKRYKIKPHMYYECSIAKKSKHQRCDYYIFVALLKDYSKAWILGQKSRSEFFDKAVFLKAGTKDVSNKYKVRADCYNMSIEDLDPIGSFKELN